jgi:uncharacterized protein (DUF4415 family)
MKVKLKRNTPAEEAAIQAGIAADPDAPEWTEDDFAQARPAAEMLPAETYAELTTPRRRGPGRRPAKVPVTLKLEPDVLSRLRASGPGWQVRAAAVLTELASKSIDTHVSGQSIKRASRAAAGQ